MPFNIFSSEDKLMDGGHRISKSDMDSLLASNIITPKKTTHWYTHFNRFGSIDPLHTASENREYLFFTKPDLNIFASTGVSFGELSLHNQFSTNPLFNDAFNRYKDVLTQLEGSVKDRSGRKNPFMCILSNACTSRLDLPGITAETQESSTNIYGTGITYRSHSYKSDNGFDFSLNFTDTPYLEVYMLAKIYDEYARLLKMGQISNKKNYIINRILPDQFSIYKIITASDAMTILYFAKITGVFISDVPRGDFSDMPQDGIKFSLSFHGQFVEDSDPVILNDFNKVSIGSNDPEKFLNIYDNAHNRVNNDWCFYPVITQEPSASRGALGLGYEYRLRWTDTVRK